MKKEETINIIYEYIRANPNIGPSALADKFNLSRAIIHRHLNKLQEQGLISKIGVSPKVFYFAKKVILGTKREKEIILDAGEKEIIQKNFFFVDADGTILRGVNGFSKWCEDRNFNFLQKAKEYTNIVHKYSNFKKGKLIDGMRKIKTTFQKVCVNKVYFVDFYAVEVFGKTRLGQMLLYAKQGQNRKMMKELIVEIKPKIEELIKKEKIEAVGFVSPSVKRELQFMKVLEKELGLSLPKILIVKTKTDVIVPQKTLSKIEDRIENARKTFVVDERRFWNKVLILDDAVGSGATMNELACKIKEQKIAKKVYGFAVTGSLKGFDVISEV